MPNKYVIGNWKLNPATHSEASALANALLGLDAGDVQVGCVPSFIHIGVVAAALEDSNLWVGCQDVCAFGATGAFTGDVSAAQVADLGASFTLIGHSERRQYHGEDNDLLSKKICQALSEQLTVILCVGETKEEYEAGDTLAVLDTQLSVLDGLALSSSQMMIAYEPVWAIGTGLTPSVAEVARVHQHIKANLSTHNIDGVCVLYGGSVNDKNAAEFASCREVDGALVGGASLKMDSFNTIIAAFAQSS